MAEKREFQKEDCANNGKNGKGKQLKLDDGNTSKQKTLSLSKGKKKVDETEKPLCAICLYEGKRRITGKLDCCSHSFCFACINKWAKKESSCPLCKQTFKQITKLPVSFKAGIESKTVVIQVPERDQDSEIIEEFDFLCTECNESANESPVIFCNNCGAAAHDFCVGCGYVIGGSGWHCGTCQHITGALMFRGQMLFGDIHVRVPVFEYSATTGTWETAGELVIEATHI